MSIDPTSCTSSGELGALLLLWFCGIMLGVGLTLLSVRMWNQLQRRKQRKHQIKEEAACVQRKQQEEAALIRRKQQEEVLDHLVDERIGCSECWQERHPGMHFPFPGLRLCGDHSNRLVLEKAFSAGVNQQQSIDHLSSVNNSVAVEEICA